MVSSAVFFSGGILVFFGLIPSPKDVGLSDPDADHKEEVTVSETEGINVNF